MISEEYGGSFDELFKEDERYIKFVDETKSKMTKFKKAFIIAVILLIAVLVGFFTLLNIAFKPTQDAKRINSDTNVKMLVDLPGSTPSRAITFTIEKEKNNKSYNHSCKYI